jgi:MHS family proline/betaine transporter-like MFS transporter
VSDETPTPRRAIVAAAAGNLLEAYDFAVYGYFAVTLSRLFFPTGDPTTSLLAAVATFGVGFAMRPLGAVVLGTLADRRGRKAALSVTIFAMAAGTALLGIVPTYDRIGVWAPVLVVLARLVQGFSAGGEVGTATVFLAEHAHPSRRGFVTSWQQASQATALLLGSLLGAALNAWLPPAALESWGWRVPFLLGLLIGPVGYYCAPGPPSRRSSRRPGASPAVRSSSRCSAAIRAASPPASPSRSRGRWRPTSSWSTCPPTPSGSCT